MSGSGNVFVISSLVVSGQVGLKAIVPALRCLDMEAVTLPSTVLAAHPAAFPDSGPPPVRPTEPDDMLAAADWLQQAGALDDCAAVLTGYLPTPAHVDAAAHIVKNLKSARPGMTYCCDPICGDHGRLYLPEAVLDGLRDTLLPLADMATPNLYELGRLAEVDPCTDDAATVAAARHLNVPHLVVTSSPAADGRIAALAVGDDVYRCETAKTPDGPHGTGDFFAALYLGLTLQSDAMALGKSCATLAQLTAQTPGTGQLPHGPAVLAPAAITDKLPL